MKARPCLGSRPRKLISVRHSKVAAALAFQDKRSTGWHSMSYTVRTPDSENVLPPPIPPHNADKSAPIPSNPFDTTSFQPHSVSATAQTQVCMLSVYFQS